jgi:WD40 repeat protein
LFSDDCGIYTFDLEKECVSQENVLEGHLDVMTSVDCLKQKAMLLTASLDGTVRMWDAKNGDSKVLYENSDVDVWGVKYYEALDKVVIGDENGDLSVLDYR